MQETKALISAMTGESRGGSRSATNYFGWREIFILGRKKPDKNSDMENETLEKIIEAGGYTQPATPSR